jgi:hypothetical protein
MDPTSWLFASCESCLIDFMEVDNQAFEAVL